MEGPVPTGAFWAKLKPYGGGAVDNWHPLHDHSADVAACLERLLERRLIRRRLAQLGGLDDLSRIQVHRLCVFAALHDLGKYNVGFQNRRLETPPFTAGHVGEALAAFRSHGPRIARALRVESMQGWAETEATIDDLLITSIAHHGRPQRVGGLGTPGVWEARGGLNPFEGLSDLRDRVEDWYPDAFRSGGEALPAVTRFHHAYNGLLTLADWIGSNESFFPYAEPGESSRFELARQRADIALRRIGLDASLARSALGGVPLRSRQVWNFVEEPRPAQRFMEELGVESSADRDGSLAILEAPTGSGKTEAALIRFLRMFEAGQVDGLYFALPTRAAATQMWRRVRRTLRTVIPDRDPRPFVTLAVPGYLDAEAQREAALEDFGALWPEDDRRWRHLTWASERPKRYLAGAVVVGTVDQVLLSALAVDHSHLRSASLLRSLLVVDEIHASDAYMSRILEEVLERHLGSGGHALLMSATLGEASRSRFLRVGSDSEGAASERAVEAAVAEAYPAVTLQSHGGEDDEVVPLEVSEVGGKHVDVELDPSMNDPLEVARLALDAAAHGALVLVIRNTVKDCRQVQRSLEQASAADDPSLLFSCEGVPAPHHSRFAGPDRQRLDWRVEQVFGRERMDAGQVLAATQTVEQSLDIDADLLVTDLCPADVLLQRVGRLHRHDRRRRPPGYGKARLVVLVPDSRDLGVHIRTGGPNSGRASGPHGLGTVYEDLRVLNATWGELESRERLELPGDARELVEASTHPDSLRSVVDREGGVWVEHGRAMDGVRRAEESVAELNLADWSVPFGDPDSLFPDRMDERIRTRLGEGDRRAVFKESLTSPFGCEIDEINIPAWMAPYSEMEDAATVVEDEKGGILFRFGPRTYQYDRWGLRRSGGDTGRDG